MKLIYAIVSDDDSSRLMAELTRAGHRVTKLNSTGGFLRSGNTTLMCVVEEEHLQDTLGIMKAYSSSRKASVNANMIPTAEAGGHIPYQLEVPVGGATVFVLNVEHFEKY